jgi:hypothetical protein
VGYSQGPGGRLETQKLGEQREVFVDALRVFAFEGGDPVAADIVDVLRAEGQVEPGDSALRLILTSESFRILTMFQIFAISPTVGLLRMATSATVVR